MNLHDDFKEWIGRNGAVKIAYMLDTMSPVQLAESFASYIEASTGRYSPLPAVLLAVVNQYIAAFRQNPPPDLMDKGRAVATLNNLDAGDREAAHGRADNVLIGYLRDSGSDGAEVATAWVACRDRIGFWYA